MLFVTGIMGPRAGWKGLSGALVLNVQ